MPWRFSAHGSPAVIRGRAAEFFQADTGFIHQNLCWRNIHAAGYIHEQIERYLAGRAPDEQVTVKASHGTLFAAPITVYPEAPPVVAWKYNPMPQPAPTRTVPQTRSKKMVKR